MKLQKVRVTNYRSIIDSGNFDIDNTKTILVGPNEAGKTAILQAIQHLNAPEGIKPLNALRDYPRAQFNEISQGDVDPADTLIVRAEFSLDDEDRSLVPEIFQNAKYICYKYLDNSFRHELKECPKINVLSDIRNDLLRLAAHADAHYSNDTDIEKNKGSSPTQRLQDIIGNWLPNHYIFKDKAKALLAWIDEILPLVDENNKKEENRLNQLRYEIESGDAYLAACAALRKRLPIFVLFSNYYRVRPLIHLEQLATRIANNTLDEDRFDYGNVCLLNLLGFSASELSKMGRASDPDADDPDSLETFREKLDERQYKLNAAEVQLTREIRSIWKPDEKKGEDAKLRLRADGQYLKVTVEDDLGVEVELDQRSEGFQWLVSFFTVFFAEAQGKYSNAILLLDEPGLSLHGLKQRDFRETISRLALNNQTLYTTHSPFLVGPEELDHVRVIEMSNRSEGTKVNTSITANDPAALLPLQEALGYDLAQSLFTQKRNLVLEGLTDYWYVEATSALLRDADVAHLNQRIALVPANTAGKVVYFATILHAQGLKVAALLDSDSAGEQAAKQDTLVHTLGNKCILRTRDFIDSKIKAVEIEDTLRHTLVKVAKEYLSWDIEEKAEAYPNRPIVKIFKNEVSAFSKYKLAKAFLKWTREHEGEDLTEDERNQWSAIIKAINNSLK